MAAPVAEFAPFLAAAHAALAAAPFATHAQLAEVQAQLNERLDDHAERLDAMQAQIAALPTLAQIQASIAAVLAPHNAPAVAAAATATTLR